GEFKFGSRNESVIFSVQTLLVKSASAVSGWLIGMGLSLVGYVPNVAQSGSAIMGIKYLMIVFPILLSIFGYVIYKKYYRLNGEYYDEIVEAIKVKREVEA
ncbi:MFS transporter, partial [Cetobacterium sp.]